MRSYRDAVDRAARCINLNGKRHPHQRRIAAATLAKVRKALLTTDLRQASNFHALHERVKGVIGSIRGVGPLTIYDIAWRIGAFRRMSPRYIYLHAGTSEGARALGLRGSFVRKQELPSAFGLLSATEIEDCLCIYKAHIQRIARR